MSTYFYSNVIWLQSGPKISTLGHFKLFHSTGIHRYNEILTIKFLEYTISNPGTGIQRCDDSYTYQWHTLCQKVFFLFKKSISNLMIVNKQQKNRRICIKQNICAGVPVAYYVPYRRILFKKSLMVLKHPYGSPEVPCTPEIHNPLLKKF